MTPRRTPARDDSAPDRRADDDPDYDGPERRMQRIASSLNDATSKWMMSWTQPAVLIVIGSMIATLATGLYRLSQVERSVDLNRIRIEAVVQDAAGTYQRRDLQTMQIDLINTQVQAIFQEV